MNWDFLTPPGEANPFTSDREFWPSGMARHTYDSIPALSCTVIKQWMKWRRTPSEFKWWLEHRWLEDKTPALVLGGYLDAILLDQGAASRYAVIPEDAPHRPTARQINAKKPSDASLAAIAYWKQFDEANAGKNLISYEQHVAAGAMAHSIVAAPTNAGVFEHCHKAVAVAPLFSEPWKCEFDLWHPSTPHIGDVKTSAEVTPDAFGRAAASLGYYTQATLYLLLARAAGFDKEIFSFVCVKNVEPWTAVTYNFRPFVNDEHRQIYEQTAMDLANAVTALKLSTVDDFVNPVDWPDLWVPPWELAKARRPLLTA